MNRFIFKTVDNVTFGVSENITAPHGFSTRAGGVSSLPHTASMNLAYGRGDDEETVRENMRIFCSAVGVSGRAVSARQIHSATVLTVTPENAGLEGVECDGFVSRTPGITLCVKTADCVPILFYDESAGVIGAAHAGWRGTAAAIQQKTVKKMCALGAEPSRIQVAVGACIHPCCYEVGGDFREQVAALRGEDFAARHIYERDGALRADLTAMNAELLQDAGVPADNISICPRCTCCEPGVFFSHRATGGVRGTMAAAISL